MHLPRPTFVPFSFESYRSLILRCLLVYVRSLAHFSTSLAPRPPRRPLLSSQTTAQEEGRLRPRHAKLERRGELEVWLQAVIGHAHDVLNIMTEIRVCMLLGLGAHW